MVANRNDLISHSVADNKPRIPLLPKPNQYIDVVKSIVSNICWLVRSQLIHLFWLLGGFSKRWWGKNQDFMLIRFLNAGI